ncbi:DUF2750 domain-containing protein [Providencia burhodogranariea]|uniref:DUF2750 domain-containing protein n=1 Tax=Providencia burhodogranariea DSM 19968 TaxID=1141662 RepID=K8VZQ1_9GAMM|nr:DUF2750 domain-containing protein [Providencia burhodogranariea]EKT53031.1 hypothetical protein OOA_19199 [Providencia burhodogranariea DSM 19968]
MFIPNPKEIDSILALSLQRKYQYFVGKVTDWEEVWTICDNGNLVTAWDSSQRLLFPVWPAKAYAERNLNGEWANFTPELLTLEHFMDEMLPDMDEANITIAIMADPDFRPNVIIEARHLLQDLIEECKQYE